MRTRGLLYVNIIVWFEYWNYFCQHVRSHGSLLHGHGHSNLEESGCCLAGVLRLLSDDVGQLNVDLLAQSVLPAGGLGEGADCQDCQDYRGWATGVSELSPSSGQPGAGGE